MNAEDDKGGYGSDAPGRASNDHLVVIKTNGDKKQANMNSETPRGRQEYEEPASFESVPEDLCEKKIRGHSFMNSKRRAGCCSIFTFWYSNNLIDSVQMNGGRLHESMIEDMNTDPDRDRKQLLRFQERLQANYEMWQRRHPGRKANDEWYYFTRNAV